MGVFKFEYFTTVDTNEVIVSWLVVEVGVVCFDVLAEVDLVKEVSFYEKVESSIDGGTGGFRV